MVDLSLADVGGPVDWVVSNPPYRKLASGRLCADSQRAVARHELRIDLSTLLHTGRRLLRKMGHLSIIYPAVRTVDLLSAMRDEGIEPKQLTMIHANSASPAQLVAVTGVHGGRPGMTVLPSLKSTTRAGIIPRPLKRCLPAEQSERCPSRTVGFVESPIMDASQARAGSRKKRPAKAL
ncbi:hypothetical protein [Desulfosarcina cetonica]|uniref:hypothetical protein n=1 Tax=Desulfosarcina cetonica TaxID=90730 RepID=UPI00155DDA01|nr:hypothetical protein [Desulfosarcina cetonica]